jgi:hypothetical protein
MKEKPMLAVITGDVTGFSIIPARKRSSLLNHLKVMFETVHKTWPGIVRAPFEVYRGDSFQGVLLEPALALRVVIFIRAGLRSGFIMDRKSVRCDARMAIGVGTIDYLPSDRGAEGDGEAFRRSGRLLDRMKGEHRLLIDGPFTEIIDELNTEFGLLDVLIAKWSAGQAGAVMHVMLGRSQRDVAKALRISPSAVTQRLKGAGVSSVERLLARYQHVMQSEGQSLNKPEIKVPA